MPIFAIDLSKVGVSPEQFEQYFSILEPFEGKVVESFYGLNGKLALLDFNLVAKKLKTNIDNVFDAYASSLIKVTDALKKTSPIKEAITNYSGIFSEDELKYLIEFNEGGSKQLLRLKYPKAGYQGNIDRALNSAFRKIAQLPTSLAEEARYLEIVKNSGLFSTTEIRVAELRYTRKPDGGIRIYEEIITDPILAKSPQILIKIDDARSPTSVDVTKDARYVSKVIVKMKGVLTENGFISKPNPVELFIKYWDGSEAGSLTNLEKRVVAERLTITGEIKADYQSIRNKLVKEGLFDKTYSVKTVGGTFTRARNKVEGWAAAGLEPRSILDIKSYPSLGDAINLSEGIGSGFQVEHGPTNPNRRGFLRLPFPDRTSNPPLSGLFSKISNFLNKPMSALTRSVGRLSSRIGGFCMIPIFDTATENYAVRLGLERYLKQIQDDERYIVEVAIPYLQNRLEELEPIEGCCPENEEEINYIKEQLAKINSCRPQVIQVKEGIEDLLEQLLEKDTSFYSAVQRAQKAIEKAKLH